MSSAANAAPRRADTTEIQVFLDRIFKHVRAGEGWVALRSFGNAEDARGRTPMRGSWVRFADTLLSEAAEAATDAARGIGGEGWVFSPPVCLFGETIVDGRRPATAANVAFAPVIAVELDARPQESLKALTAVLGAPTVVVQSGGRWKNDRGIEENRLHVYWRLREPARSKEDRAALYVARAAACRLVGADATGVSLAHPMRWPGSWHTKRAPQLCQIVGGDAAAEVGLSSAKDRLLAALEAAGLETGGTAARDRGLRRGFKTDREWGASTLLDAARLMPNAGLPWDAWNTRGMAFWDASHASAEGLEAFIAWSEKDTEGRFDPDYCEARWSHWSNSPPSDLSGGTLRKHMLAVDPAYSFADDLVSAWFEPIEDEPPAGAAGEGSGSVVPLFGDRVDASAPVWVRELNRRHGFVMNKGQATIVNEEDDGGFSFSSQNSFIARYANEKLTQGKLTTTKGEAWWEHPSRRQFLNGVDFDPDGVELGVFNLWRGFPPLRKEGEITPANAAARCARILAHIEMVVCSGDRETFDYLIRWLAHLVQRPGDKPGVAIILRGSKGTGKDTLGEYLGRMLGFYYMHASTPSQLTGRFNGHLAGRLLVHAEELAWEGSKAAEGVLKSLITAPVMAIESKGVNAVVMKSRVRVLATSNEDWVVPATFDERRFLVLDVSACHIQDTAWFGPIKDEMSDAGPAALREHLRAIDLAEFDVRKVPHTAALHEQKKQSLGVFERWWDEILDDGHAFEGENDEPWETLPALVEKAVLRERFTTWCRKNREAARETDVTITKKLASFTGIGADAMIVRPRSGESRKRCYLLPPASELRAKWTERFA